MDDEEPALYLVIAGLGIPPLLAGILDGDMIGVGPTLGLVGVALGVFGLASHAWRRIRLPRARVRRR